VPRLSEDYETALEEVIAAYEAEYNRVVAAFKDMETKASSTITTAGIFLGFVLNFIKDLHGRMSTVQNGVAILTLVLLVTAISYSVASLAVRDFARPPQGEQIHQFAKDLHRLRTGIPDTAVTLLNDRIKIWQKAVSSRRAVNGDKVARLAASQRLLLAAIVWGAVLAVVTLFSPAVPKP